MADFDVLLPVKNGIAYLTEAIESIVHQTHDDWRLLILDHGSHDGSLELAQRVSERDRRVVVFSLPQAEGLSELLNFGLKHCDCNYVLRQDADDISALNRMAVLSKVFMEDPTLVLAGSKGQIISGEGKHLGEIDVPLTSADLSASALFKTPVAHPTVAMRLKDLNARGACYGQDFINSVSPSERLRVSGLAEDYFLFGQLALTSKCINVNQNLIKYRWHDSNVSVLHQSEQLQLAIRISRYLAKSLAVVHGTDHFDPASLCNHADQLAELAEMNGQVDFTEEYQAAAALISKILPFHSSANRELAFRRVISIRSIPTMASRSLSFATRFDCRKSELKTVKSWMLSRVRRTKFCNNHPSDPAHQPPISGASIHARTSQKSAERPS
jgi:glycosyltransferase involved in cell wall biosynthesis